MKGYLTIIMMLVMYNMSAQIPGCTSPVGEANQFCAGAGGLVFPNTSDDMGVPDLVDGAYHCLYSTPNPVWYYLQIDDAGTINFQIEQNTQYDANGVAIGAPLDVDFVAFGPFMDLEHACTTVQIGSGSPNPASLVVGCSYSGVAVENFTITNAQPGEVYAILITNYNGDPGFIKLIQTNAGDPGAGSTDCSFLCNVSLPEDITLCGSGEVEIFADISSAEDSEINSIKWYRNGVLMDPNVYNTDTIIVDQAGTYKVEVDKENCTGDIITDEMIVTIVPKFEGSVVDSISICDDLNDNSETFDLAKYLSEQTIPSNFEYKFFATQANANANVSPLGATFTTAQTTIYLRVSDKTLPSCFVLKPVQLKFKSILPDADFNFDNVRICEAYLVPPLPQNQTYAYYETLDGSGNVTEKIAIPADFRSLGVGSYKIYVQEINNEGCLSTQSYFVEVLSCVVPRGISPNADGNNDYLDLTDYHAKKVQIFNRYGKMVFDKPNYRNEWFGQDNSGKLLPSGTYYIVLETHVRSITGWVELVREIK